MKRSENLELEDLDLAASEQGIELGELNTIQAEEVKRKSVTGAISYALRTFLLYGISIGSTFLLAAFLSKEQFGVYGIVVSISGFFTIISDIGLAASLIQKREPPTLVDLRTTFTVQQVLAWIVCILVILTALFYHSTGKIGMDAVYLAGAFALCFPIVSLKTISSILLERDLRFDQLVIPAIVEAVAFNLIAVFLAWRGFGLMSYTVAVLARSILGVITMFFIKRWDMGLSFSRKSFLDLMKVGGKFQLNDMLAKTKDDLFFIVVAFFLPAGDLGYINWATRFSKMPYSFTVDSVMAVTFPTFSRLQNDPKLLRKAIEKTIFFITLVAFPLLIGFAFALIPFTALIPAFHKWQPALFLLFLFSFNLCWSAVTTPLVNTLNAIGKINISLRLMLIWTLLQWTLTPIMIWKFGFVGVGVAAALISFTGVIVVYLARLKIKFNFFDQVWRQILATIVMGSILVIFQSTWSKSFFYLALGIGLGGATYLALMLLTGFEKMRVEISSVLLKK